MFSDASVSYFSCYIARPVSVGDSLNLWNALSLLHASSMFAVKAKLYGVIYNKPSLSPLMKHLVIGQRQNAPTFSAFHWTSQGSLDWSPFRSHEGSTFTEKDRNKLNYRI